MNGLGTGATMNDLEIVYAINNLLDMYEPES